MAVTTDGDGEAVRAREPGDMASRIGAAGVSPVDYVIVQTTTDAEDTANAMADDLIARRLCACVHIARIRSVYRWRGAVEHADEYILAAKTRRALADRLASAIRERHTYEIPEIVILPIMAGHRPYLDWIAAETAGS